MSKAEVKPSKAVLTEIFYISLNV